MRRKGSKSLHRTRTHPESAPYSVESWSYGVERHHGRDYREVWVEIRRKDDSHARVVTARVLVPR